MKDVDEGSILVSHPDLEDPDFGRSVILILRHHWRGDTGVNVAVKPLEGTRIYKSGPLPLKTLIRLHKYDPTDTNSEVIPDTGYAFCADSEAREPLPDSMVLIGYAGWGQGQLAREMARGVWIPTTTSLAAILAVPPEQRWKVAAAGAGIAVEE